MSAAVIDSLPGFRRRFIVTPGQGWVQGAVEDDFHCMAVLIRHDGVIATEIEPQMERAPWSTCPGAVEQLKATFTGIRLDAFAQRGEKTRNCTHLHDLALLAAAHADDGERLVYDVLVADPVDGVLRSELRRNGMPVMAWTIAGGTFVEPAELAGQRLDTLRSWIDSLKPPAQEEAKVFRWATMIAGGRILPMEQQSTATSFPANCYTFQPDRAAVAKRIGVIRDFSDGTAQPLEQLVAPSGQSRNAPGLPFANDAA